MGGADESEGTVEVCFDHLWGLVTQTGWDVDDAQVVCRQLGYSTIGKTLAPFIRCPFLSLGALAVYDSTYGRPMKTVHLLNVGCDGNELNINECTKTVLSLNEGKTMYKNATIAGVSCNPQPPTPPSCTTMFNNVPPPDPSQCTNGDIQLIDPTDPKDNQGRLEYCVSGRWSPFCSIDEATASVACKQLGHTVYTSKEK